MAHGCSNLVTADPEVQYRLASQAFLLRHYVPAWCLCWAALNAPPSPVFSPSALPETAVSSPTLLTPPNVTDDRCQVALGSPTPKPSTKPGALDELTLTDRWWVLYLTLVGSMMDGQQSGQLGLKAQFQTEATVNGVRDVLARWHHRYDQQYQLCSPSVTSRGSLARLTPDLTTFRKSFPLHLDQVWHTVLEAYRGTASDIPSEVLVSLGLLALQYQAPSLGAQWVETWLASIPDYVLDILEEAPVKSHLTDPLVWRQQWAYAYEKVTELYVLHLLPAMGDWASAEAFLEYNQVLPVTTRQRYHAVLKRMRKASKVALRRQRKKAQTLKRQRQEQPAVAQTQPQPAKNTPATPNGSPLLPTAHVVVKSATAQVEESVLLNQPRHGAVLNTSKPIHHSSPNTFKSQPLALWHTVQDAVHRLLGDRSRRHFLAPILVGIFFTYLVHRHRAKLMALVRQFLSKLWLTIVMGTKNTYL